jgi:hypothetical protein
MDIYLVCLNGDICHARSRVLMFSCKRITVGISLRCCGPRYARLSAHSQSQVPSVPPDEGKCRSSARQTGYRCPRAIFYQACLAMSSAPSTPSYTRKPRRATCAATHSPIFHVIACACPSIRRAITRDPHQHHFRRPRTKRAVLPSRTATHAPFSYTPGLRCVLPSRRTAFARVKHSAWLAPC